MHRPLQPFSCHVSKSVYLFRFEMVFFSTSHRVFSGHVLHQRPQIQSIGVITFQTRDSFSIWLSDGCQSFFVVTMKDDGRTTHHFRTEKLMKVFVLFVDERKVDVLWQCFKQVPQSKTRDTDAILQHVKSQNLIETRLFVQRLQKGNNVFVVIPDQKVSQCFHIQLLPDLLTVLIIFFTDVLIFQRTKKKSFFGWKNRQVQTLQILSHIHREKKPFLFFDFKRCQIFGVREAGSNETHDI